jgi:ABC-2 type transport system ATP-binding protein
MSELAVHTQKLCKKFGDITAVNNVDLQIPRGQIYGFLGPNGSGKTTIIRMLCGLLTPSSGSASILGLSVPEQAEALRQKIGYMTQKFSLYDDLTVEENMYFIAKIYGLRRSAARERISDLLQRYALSDLRNRSAGAMRGGQRQRLALATATIHQPTMLFLDEPTSAVDPENRRDFWEKLFDLSDQGTTILVSTHYMDEAERCHQLAILDLGELKTQGTPQDLMNELSGRVLEVEGEGLRRVKEEILQLAPIQSVAQQGLKLRVLFEAAAQDPVTFLQNHLQGKGLHVTPTRPSLEDVFVAATAAGKS